MYSRTAACASLRSSSQCQTAHKPGRSLESANNRFVEAPPHRTSRRERWRGLYAPLTRVSNAFLASPDRLFTLQLIVAHRRFWASVKAPTPALAQRASRRTIAANGNRCYGAIVSTATVGDNADLSAKLSDVIRTTITKSESGSDEAIITYAPRQIRPEQTGSGRCRTSVGATGPQSDPARRRLD